MPDFAPESLASACGGRWLGRPRGAITGFSIDTRSLQPGDLFVALRTEKRDGHAFVDEALGRGASGAMVAEAAVNSDDACLQVVDTERALQAVARAHRAMFERPVVGVTGSAGKTSTKDLLAILLGARGRVAATRGNLNNHLGVPLTLLGLEPGVDDFAVVEAGINAPGEMDVLASMIAPEAAVITTVAAAHLEKLGSLAGVAREKARLGAAVPSGGLVAVPSLCLAYPEFRDIGDRLVVAVPEESGRFDVPVGAQAVRFRTVVRDGSYIVDVLDGACEGSYRIEGATRGMAANAVLALLVAERFGVSPAEARERLRAWRPAGLRGEVLRDGERLVYVDCYNANPASMLDALERFLDLTVTASSRLFVVGCMEELGEHASSMHREVGTAWRLRPSDVLVVLGGHAPAFAEGVRIHAPDARVLTNPERALVESLVADAAEAVFLKGSRAYRLESYLGRGGPAAGGQAKEAAA
ncbi:UDP-N-acetylmuramoyl-tripeptide--D-alanyl-D-alanine ligase [Opitutales bacterium ASA1]|uniref:UDP-N-acetylmuramoyl-tripeptide--D-alanyl-D- alanine ligase n=1 Tax=Congregicoccus parvus TaxID=3081749 RepID=UPI002B296FD8|nr:UDP-N-acetylmuramoyl-tripeptide--D-alanyl-D-alanine ligase [Opitutales bacterium ASA1]